MTKTELQAYFWPKVWQPLPPREKDWLNPPKPLPKNIKIYQGSFITNLTNYVEVNLTRLDGPPRLAALAEENLNHIYKLIHQLNEQFISNH